MRRFHALLVTKNCYYIPPNSFFVSEESKSLSIMFLRSNHEYILYRHDSGGRYSGKMARV